MTSFVAAQTISYKPTVGVLALQGCVTPHKFHIEALGAKYKEVKTEHDLTQIDGLILPGGESTTMLRLIHVFDMEDALHKAFKTMPVWGICAGSILMAQTVLSPAQKSFSLLDMTIERNAYGSQLDSFNDNVQGSPVSFIRAPQIKKLATDINIKHTHNNQPVWVQKNIYMATTFHPELSQTHPSIVHKEFLNLILSNKNLSIN